MIRLGTTGKTIAIGQSVTARAVSKCQGGYIVEFGLNQQGLALTDAELPYGKEMLVQVVGYRQGLPVVHTLFAGFGR